LDSAWANRRVGGIEALQLLNKIGQYESANYEGIHEALANKLARILWAMMKTGEAFRGEMFAKA
jgi:hypothetical protein